MTTKEIAEKLLISEKTVRNHISNTMQKLGVKSRSSAVVELINSYNYFCTFCCVNNLYDSN